MRCILSEWCEGDFQMISIICRILFHQRKGDVQVTLDCWHNNYGFEFDVLQAVFPATITLSGAGDIVNPVAIFEGTSRRLDLFMFVAISVDAEFRISSRSLGVELAFCDTILTIDCPKEIESVITKYLFQELSLQRLDD
jgi:hypothetical protein